jgi:hypothetical protein
VCVKFTEFDHCAFVVQGNSYLREQLVLKWFGWNLNYIIVKEREHRVSS